MSEIVCIIGLLQILIQHLQRAVATKAEGNKSDRYRNSTYIQSLVFSSV